MSAPVVCPSCSRVFQPTLTACPQCGWETELSAEHRRTKVIAVDKPPTRLARIELVKEAPRTEPRLELPPDDDEPKTARPLKLPDDDGPKTARPLKLPDDDEPKTASPLRLPDEEPEAPRLPQPAPRASSSSLTVHTVNELESAAARIALELPTDEAAPEEPAPRPSSPSAPARAPTPSIVLPWWLSEPLEPAARWGLVLTTPLALLLLVDALAVGRPGVGAGLLWLGFLAVVGGSVGQWLMHRGAIAAIALAGVVLTSSAFAQPLLALGFAVWAAATIGITGWPRLRTPLLAAGSLAIVTFVPSALDGVLSRPLVGELRAGANGPALRWPAVDQSTGLQLPTGPASLKVSASEPGTTRLSDATLGLEVGLKVLPRDRPLVSAMADAQTWLETLGLERVAMLEPVRVPGLFDAATQAELTAKEGRGQRWGIVRVAVLGKETFAIAAWASKHRRAALEPTMRGLVEQAFFRPPMRARLSPAVREAVASTVVHSIDGAFTGVRASVGGKVVLLMPASAPTTIRELQSEQGRFPVELEQGVVSNDLRLVLLGGGTAAPLRRSSAAPMLSRVVRAGQGFSGGWLADAPGHDRRALDLTDSSPGPVFELDGKLVGFAIGDELITTDTLEKVLAQLAGKVTLLPAETSPPAPLFEIVPPGENASGGDLTSLTRSVVLARSTAGVTAAVVVSAGDAKWALVADALIAPPGASVSITLPPNEVRGVEVVRTSGGVVLLTTSRLSKDELRPIKLMDALAEGASRRLALGFREDPATSTLALKSVPGELTADGFDPDPAPPMSGGPVMTADGRVAALRIAGGQRVMTAPRIQALSVAGLSDVLWRFVAEPTGECQLAAHVRLEDPLEEATVVRVRMEEAGAGTLPPRLTQAAIGEARPKQGAADLTIKRPCWLKPQWVQFEVQSASGTRATRVQQLPVFTTLPDVLTGRSGPTEGASRPPASEIAWLWELPPRIAMHHACRLKPAECERACYIDELDACTLDGRYALSTGEAGRAVGRLTPRCEAGDVEACTLLAWALEKRPSKTSRPKLEQVLQPWCAAGNTRACAALAPQEWKKTLEQLTRACTPASNRCNELAWHLLSGPRLDADVRKALGLFRQACSSGDERACGDNATESVRLELEEPLAVMPRATAGCRGNHGGACLLEAFNAVRGLTVPRTPLGAEKLIAQSCSAGSERACLMDYR